MAALYTSHFNPDGKEIIIRAANADDAENLILLKKSYIKNTTSIPLYDYEYTNTIIQEKEWIQKYDTQENSLILLAEHKGKLIGNIDLTGNQRKKLFHTGMIGMGIHPEWQNKKIGSFLLEHTIIWALRSPLKIIWLEVYSTNAGGIKLYEKFGFENCGSIKDFFRERQHADKLTMVKYL